ncbi:golgin subfamily A member 5-like [Tubulanus polymorphus]|uniref:golgin subfamily A member 5-like n=1 Tax=Tubulanus polymorphus TaxID=672921 RepID=UPI003DA4F782
MSWLSGLANKAEELLNKVDQTAAVALQNDEEASPGPMKKPSLIRNTTPKTSEQSSFMSNSQIGTNKPSYSTNSNPINTFPSGPKQNHATTRNNGSGGALLTVSKSPAPVNSKPKKDKDEELFEFLNSDVKLENGKTEERWSVGHSRHSSISSTVSNKSATKLTVDKPESASPENTASKSSTPEEQELESTPNDLEPQPVKNVQDEVVIAGQSVSSMELENKLLRNEISSLNGEMASLLQRAKSAEKELRRKDGLLNDHGSQLSQSDQIVRELQARENDLMESLTAKDSQLAVLRVRIEEADAEVNDMKKKLSSVQQDKMRILQDHSDSSGLQSHALDSLKDRLRDTDAALQQKEEAFQQIQQELMQKEHRHQEEQTKMAESLALSHKKMTEEKTRTAEMNAQLKNWKQNHDAVRKELTDYKEKAARILQSKDKLITALREGSSNTMEVGASGPEISVSSSFSSIELDHICQERDLYREELQQCRLTIEQLRGEISDLEVQMSSEETMAQNNIQNLEEQLTSEKRKREDADHEVLKQKQELRCAHEELLRQKTDFQSRLRDRGLEVDKLRNQLTIKQNSTGQAELESRLHSLTESLIQKQTMLEALSTEKNSLGLQLERLQLQYQDMQSSATRAATTTLHVSEDDEIRHRLPGFMRESPLDTKVARGMKKAANTLDRFSVRLGIFLRRYPIARIFVICYMVALHLWVSIVLLTYQPEIHSHDYQPQAPDQKLPPQPL